jgi:hypothetical protein
VLDAEELIGNDPRKAYDTSTGRGSRIDIGNEGEINDAASNASTDRSATPITIHRGNQRPLLARSRRKEDRTESRERLIDRTHQAPSEIAQAISTSVAPMVPMRHSLAYRPRCLLSSGRLLVLVMEDRHSKFGDAFGIPPQGRALDARSTT